MKIRWILARLFSNLGKVDKYVWRSSQRWILYIILPFLRIDAILNLSHKPSSDIQDRFEVWLCKKLKIEYKTFPTITYKDSSFLDAYSFLMEKVNAGKKTLVHCEGGKDRTGAVIAWYKFNKYGLDAIQSIVRDWAVHRFPYNGWIIFLFKNFMKDSE